MRPLLLKERRPELTLEFSIIFALFLSLSVFGVPGVSFAAEPKAGILLIEDSVQVMPNSSSLKIPFRILNDSDSLAGFEIVIVLSNPDLVVVDTLNPLDLGGSVLTGWSVGGQNLGNGLAYRISGVYFPPLVKPLPPGNELRELYKLNLLWRDILPDTICRTAVDGNISQVQTHFSDPAGNLITCTAINGGIYVTCPPCGDADGNNIVTISDVVYLINYIFAGGPPPIFDQGADVDCSGIITISDVVYIVNFIFAGGPVPCSVCLY